MNCPGCRARNPIGNKFCRECGQKIPLEENTLAQEEALKAEAERARERVAQLLTRAFTLSQQGKPAEALPLAEEAAELLPSSTSALTLCSTLYERLGKNDQAIAMMEKVVALNPESTVDVDKLDRLKRGVHLLPARPTLAAAEESDDERRRWFPIAIAVGAGALVLTVGGIALVKSQDKKDPVPLAVQEVVATPAPVLLPGARNTTAGGVAPGGAGPLSPPTVEARSDPFAPIGRVPMGATPEPQRNPMRASGPRAGRPEGGVALPNPREAFSREPQGQTVLGVPPVSLPSVPGGTGIRNPQLPALGGIQRNPDAIPAGPPTSPQGQGIPAGRPTGAEPPAESGGSGGSYIRVREHQGGGSSGNTGGSGENQTSSRSGDPLLRAQTLQVAGRYREAITTYREALSAGAPAGDVQQGIALCHQRLGEKAPARSAYQQAITAFEAQVRAGRSVDLASRGIAACRAALDVLGS